MKTKLLLCSIFLFSVSIAQAQITGSDTVCAGVIYNYTANIPGSVTYTWTVPANWYNMVGQGTSQITINCNSNAGQVCAEGFDSIGGSMGTQCMTTTLGILGGGGGSWSLWPTGSNLICDNFFTVNVTPVITFQGGGGGCPAGCGSGISNPNCVWALYSGQTFIGVIGTAMNLGWGTYYAAYVDTTLGTNFPQACQIHGGCGGGGGGSFSINPVNLWANVTQTPSSVCVGDTVEFYGNGNVGSYWYSLNGLNPISSLYNPYQLTAIVTSSPASLNYQNDYQIPSGISWGSTCSASTIENVNTAYCNPSTSFQSSSTAICENSCISFTNSTLHATSYQWSFPGAIPSNSTDTNPTNICYANAGMYDVILVSGNAMYSDTLLLPGYITVTQSPQASFSTSQTNFCNNECIGFSNTSSNATSYSWNFPGAIPAASSDTSPQNICYNSPGNFDVSLICWNGGCTDTLSMPNYITVNPQPQTSFSTNQTNFCTDDCIGFSNASSNATSYSWNFPGAIPVTSSDTNPQNICYNSPGNFEVSLICWNGGCTDTLSMPNYITVNPYPQVSFSTSQTNFCTNDCIGFSNTTTNATSYSWNFPGAIPATSSDTSPQNICYNSPGSFDVILTCWNGACADTISLQNYLTVNPLPQASMTAASFLLCPGSCTDFLNSSVNATSYNWSFPGATPATSIQTDPSNICYNIPGIYDVILVSSNSICTDTLLAYNYITVYPQPSPPNVSQVSDSLIANTGYAYYQWYFNGNLISGATSNFYVATQNGDYNLIATDSLGCEVEAVLYNVLTGLTLESPTGNFTISPNPVQSALTIQFDVPNQINEVVIFNILGETLITKAVAGFASNFSIDVSSIPDGIYSLLALGDGIKASVTFIKE